MHILRAFLQRSGLASEYAVAPCARRRPGPLPRRQPAAKLPTLISAKKLAQPLPFWSKEGKIHSSVIESEAQDRGGIAESGGRAGMPAAAGIAAKSNGVKHHLGVENADRVCMHTRPNTAGSFVYLSLTHTSSSSDPCSVQSCFVQFIMNSLSGG
jgi:hypothetical protein